MIPYFQLFGELFIEDPNVAEAGKISIILFLETLRLITIGYPEILVHKI